jgi:steroid 5-alpha reductase family enzyme
VCVGARGYHPAVRDTPINTWCEPCTHSVYGTSTVGIPIYFTSTGRSVGSFYFAFRVARACVESVRQNHGTDDTATVTDIHIDTHARTVTGDTGTDMVHGTWWGGRCVRGVYRVARRVWVCFSRSAYRRFFPRPEMLSLVAFSACLVQAPTSLRGARATTQRHEAIPSMLAPLPSLPVLAAVCTAPTCIGFWRSEYGVSYAYGAATAATGALFFRAAPTPVAAAHAAAVCFYGLRLNIFLLWRECNVARFRDFRDKVEERAKQAGGRLKRAPFVISCSALYFCMSSPLMLTSRLGASGLTAGLLVGVAWFGLLLAAWGDLTKSIVKERLGPDTLVTQGPFRFFRHPNYTGEQILWSANCLVAFATAIRTGGLAALMQNATWLTASVIGWAGILFVLARATANLEAKQAERFEQFARWRASSWAGIALR